MCRFLSVAFLALLLAGCAGTSRSGKAARTAAPTAVPLGSSSTFKDPEGARTTGKGSAVDIGLALGSGGWPSGLAASEADIAGALKLAHQMAHADRATRGQIAVDVRGEEAAVEEVTAKILSELREKRPPLPPRSQSPAAPQPLVAAPGWAPPDYAVEASTAQRGTRLGALAHCVNTWRRSEQHRRKVFEEIAAHPPGENSRVLLLEAASFPEPLYGYLLVVDGERVAGVLTGKAQRSPAPEVHALGGVALGAALRSDESAADRVTDGACYFLTVREGLRQVRFAWFAPELAADTQEPELLLLNHLAPLVESVWAGPEYR